MNIVLVIFDSLRRDCVGAYGQPPWGRVSTPHLDRLAEESVMFTRAFPNVLPTLPARVALYSGKQLYPFHGGEARLRGDFVGAPGWGPIPEAWPTLAEQLSENGFRAALVSDVYHMFKPSKNFWRGFDQWTFLRGNEADPARSGPAPTEAEIDAWLPPELRALWARQEDADVREAWTRDFARRCLLNARHRRSETDFYPARVFTEAARWLDQNQDADRFFLTVECFDPHEPWVVPEHYRRMYLTEDGPEQVLSLYGTTEGMDDYLLRRTRANYSGAVTQCDRWFGHFVEAMRALGRLDDTLLIVAADHGHLLGDGDYLGKRGYPSRPEVFELPLFVRRPGGEGGGAIDARLVQHVDISASILDVAGLSCDHIDGFPLFESNRDHVTVGWGSTPTVVDERWWLNCKADGSGVFLHDLASAEPFDDNVADDHPEEVGRLFATAVEDAGGSFPEWILELAATEQDAPGCSPMAARR